MRAVFQPLIDLDSGDAVGFEAAAKAGLDPALRLVTRAAQQLLDRLAPAS